MDSIEQKALALLNEVAVERGYNIGAPADRRTHYLLEVACRAIEQHEAFRQEVSDAVEAALSVFDQLVLDDRGEAALRGARLVFARFIIAKPDPLVEAIHEVDTGPLWDGTQDYANKVRAAIEKRGGKIVWGEG